MDRSAGGIPDLAVLAEYGDALQTVSEQIIAEQTKLGGYRAAKALA